MKLIDGPTGNRIGDDVIQAFVDDVLDDSRRNELLAYIAAHPHEAERVNGYFRQRAALASLRQALVDDDDAAFCPDMQRQLQAALGSQRAVHVGIRMAAAIAVVLPLGLGSWFAASHMRAAPIEPIVQQAAFSPEFPFGGIFETSSVTAGAPNASPLDPLARYLNEQDLSAPDLASIGLSLVATDEIAGVDAPATRLVYADAAGEQLSVFVGLASSTAPQALAIVPEGHLSMSWRAGPLIFAVVAPMDMPQLHDVMQLVTEGTTEVAEVPQDTASAEPVTVEPAAIPEITSIPGDEVQIVPADQTSPAITPPAGELGKEQPKVL
jgi:anti-sigma factor RsiW